MPDRTPTPAADTERVADGFGPWIRSLADDTRADLVADEIYRQLRHRAEAVLAGSSADLTVGGITGLVSEAFLRLAQGGRSDFRDRDHFLAAAAVAMRCIVIDHLRSRSRRPAPTETLDQLVTEFSQHAVDLIELDDALAELAACDLPMAHAIEMHFFAGVEQATVAEILGIPFGTFARRFRAARAWVRARMEC